MQEAKSPSKPPYIIGNARICSAARRAQIAARTHFAEEFMEPQQLLTKIESHLAKTGESASAFGKRILNDPAFVLKLRNDRRPFPHTEAKVLKAMRGRPA